MPCKINAGTRLSLFSVVIASRSATARSTLRGAVGEFARKVRLPLPGGPRIQAVDLPPRAMTLLVCAPTFGRIVQPVIGGATSGGDLCIAGGPIVRLEIGVSSPSGQFAFPLELSRLLPPGMPLSSLVGEARLFQCFYRDLNSPTGGGSRTRSSRGSSDGDESVECLRARGHRVSRLLSRPDRDIPRGTR